MAQSRLILLMSGMIVCGSAATVLKAGGSTGNAADWRRMAFFAAKREAANWTNTVALNPESFEQVEEVQNPMVAKFVAHPSVLKELALDITRSRHIYLSEKDPEAANYATCAWTNDPTSPSLTDITLTLPHCESKLVQDGANFANVVLIHESVHHLMNDDRLRQEIGAQFTGTPNERRAQEEDFCDDVATAIRKAFAVAARSYKPHWLDISIPLFETRTGEVEVFEPRGFHSTVWTGQTGNPKTSNRMLIWGGCREGEATIYACGGSFYFNDGALYQPSTNEWTAINKDHAPSPRAEPLSIWTGNSADSNFKNQLLIWGGCRDGDGCATRLNDGGFYDVASDSWTPIAATADAPSPRTRHAGAWTGQELVVWGGVPNNNPDSVYLAPPLRDGGVYNAERKTWTPIPADLPYAPTARAHHAAFWTGDIQNSTAARKVLIWGGCLQEAADFCANPFSDGSFFDPKTMSWSTLRTTGLIPKPRHDASVLYVEHQARLYVFGGIDRDGNVLADGHVLDLNTLRWTPMALAGDGRFKHRAVWAGDRMILFGGKVYNSGSRIYELASKVVAYIPGVLATQPGRWMEYQTEELTPLKTFEHSSVWTGNSMIVWGGQIYDRGFTSTGSQFFPGISSF